MLEPFYVAQTAECKTPEQARLWFEARTADAKARGGKHARYSQHPTTPDILLVEVWNNTSREVLEAGGEGEPRWALRLADDRFDRRYS